MTGLALERGDRLPHITAVPPGPRSRQLAETIERFEAPVVNTLYRGKASVVWREALGANVVDVDDNLYIDLTSGFGVAAVGHRNPEVIAAVAEQSAHLVHGLADVASHPARIELARRLCRLSPIPVSRVHFAISGSDAVEIALKTAWLATERRRIIAFEPAYHGTTLGALAATSREAFRAPFVDQLNPHVTRLAYGAESTAINAALADDDVAAVLVEPIVGREGVLLPPKGWLAGLAESCREYGSLLVADEVLTGFGRTGDWFVCQAEEVVPDLLCCGKALGGGLPIAAVLGRAELLECWARGGEALHTATFLANPLACAAALATLDILESEALPERAAELGSRVDSLAAEWRELPQVRSVNGRGLLWTIELDSSDLADRVARHALVSGLLMLASGPRIQLAPPLIISERQWMFALKLIDHLLRDAGS